MKQVLFKNLTQLPILAKSTHTRINCSRCKRKRDRGYISKLNLCRICFRELAVSLGFNKI